MVAFIVMPITIVYTVLKNVKMHNKKSPFLIGDFQKDDIIKEAKQVSYIDRQLSLF